MSTKGQDLERGIWHYQVPQHLEFFGTPTSWWGGLGFSFPSHHQPSAAYGVPSTPLQSSSHQWSQHWRDFLQSGCCTPAPTSCSMAKAGAPTSTSPPYWRQQGHVRRHPFCLLRVPVNQAARAGGSSPRTAWVVSHIVLLSVMQPLQNNRDGWF